MKKEELIQLYVGPKEDGYILKLDDKELHHVVGYTIEECCSPIHMQGISKLTLEMMVNQVENQIPSSKEERNNSMEKKRLRYRGGIRMANGETLEGEKITKIIMEIINRFHSEKLTYDEAIHILEETKMLIGEFSVIQEVYMQER